MTRRSSGIMAPSPGSHSKPSKLLLHTPRSGGGGRISSILSPTTSSLSLSSSNQKQQQQQHSIQRQRGSTSAFKVMKRSLDRLSSSTSTLTSPEFDVVNNNNNGAETAAEPETVKVCVRIRPLLSDGTIKNGEQQHHHQATAAPRAYVLGPIKNTIVKNLEIFSDSGSSSTISSNNSNNTFSFNHVYGETSTTRQLYDDMVAEIVESVGCHGRNGTVFTYGQTSTGKTHTMHGIIMAAGKDLFTMRDQNGIVSDELLHDGDENPPTTSHSVTSVRISCMELYNEELRDLLCTTTTTSTTTSLSIQEDRRGNVQIPGLSERTVGNIDELMEVIQIAEENRTVGSTAMNERSSRSHTIFRVTFEKKETIHTTSTNSTNTVDEFAQSSNDREEKENNAHHSHVHNNNKRTCQQRTKVTTTSSTLNLVDLAGSESVRVTGAVGERQKEGGKINQR